MADRNFEDELLRLRQRTTGVAPPPKPLFAPSHRDVGGYPPPQAPTAPASGAPAPQQQHGGRPPASGGGLSVLSLIAAADMSVNVQTTPRTDAAALDQLQRAVGAFDTSAIDDFAYDVTLEQERADEGKQCLYRNDPFVFAHQGSAGGQAQAANGANPRLAARKGNTTATGDGDAVDWGEGTPSTSTGADGRNAIPVAEMLQRRQLQQKQNAAAVHARVTSGPSGSLYALPSDGVVSRGVLERERVHDQRVQRSAVMASAARQMTPSVHTPQPPSGASPQRRGSAPPTGSTMVLYRPPTAAPEIVSDGRIAFCPGCHRVVLGSGKGRCPHCNVRMDADQPHAPVNEGAGGVGTEIATEVAPVADPADAAPVAHGFPPGSAQALEAEEAAKFRAAVAAWRRGDGATEDATGVGVDTSNAEGLAPFHACLREELVEAPALYFSRLWIQNLGAK